MPNKEGGYAPNYTPTATTDGHRGFIVDCEVTAEVNETQEAATSVDRIEKTFGQKPTKFLTDGGNNSGAVMQEMEERGVEFYAPAAVNQPPEGHPAKRDDPREPIPTQQWPDLPRNKAGRLHDSCFVYDPQGDQYYCPQGEPLPFLRVKIGSATRAPEDVADIPLQGVQELLVGGGMLPSRDPLWTDDQPRSI